MLGREIWDKLPECTFENFEIARGSEGNSKFSKNREGDFSQRCNVSYNKPCDYVGNMSKSGNQ